MVLVGVGVVLLGMLTSEQGRAILAMGAIGLMLLVSNLLPIIWLFWIAASK